MKRTHWVTASLLYGLLLLVLMPYSAQAQYSRFQEPVWHPTENIIAVTNAARIRFYSSDFSELLDEYTLATIQSATLGIGEMAWSPDGTMIAVSIQGDNVAPELQVWDFQRGQRVTRITQLWPAALFSWGAQSDRIALVHMQGLGYETVRIYKIPSGALIQEFDPTPNGEMGQISTLVWSPDNRQMALDFARANEDLYFLDVETGNFTESPIPLISDIDTPRYVYSPDSRQLMGIQRGDDKVLTIIDTETYQVTQTLGEHTDRILNINWTEAYILTTDVSGITRLWNPVTTELVAAFQTGPSGSSSFSPGGSLFVADSFDLDTVVVRDSTTGDIVAQLDESVPNNDEVSDSTNAP